MIQPPRQQAYRRGDHPEPEGPGCVTCGVFFVVALLIGGVAMYLLLHAYGLLV